MRENSFRTRVASGAFTLPFMAGLSVLLWLLPGFGGWQQWAGLAAVGLTTYLLAELNNRYALLRIRSRMVGSSFLALALACPGLRLLSPEHGAMVALVVAYFQFFAAYQQHRPEGHLFYAFLCWSLASFCWPPLLLAVPLLLLCLLLQLRALTGRSWLAAMMGVALPYWCLAAWGIWQESLRETFLPFAEAFRLAAPDYAAIPSAPLAVMGFTAVLSLLAMLHFSQTFYKDKIRTRLFYYFIISIELLLLLACALQPQHYTVLLPLLIANSAPVIAHYFALARGRAADYFFIVCLVLLTGLTLFNHLDLWTLL